MICSKSVWYPAQARGTVAGKTCISMGVGTNYVSTTLWTKQIQPH